MPNTLIIPLLICLLGYFQIKSLIATFSRISKITTNGLSFQYHTFILILKSNFRVTASSTPLLDSAWQIIQKVYRPSTASAHRTHFKSYQAFTIFMKLPIDITLHRVLAFLEFQPTKLTSVKVIRKYLSAISSTASLCRLEHSAVSHPLTLRYDRALSLNSPF